MNKDKRPVKASSWDGLAVRESGSLMGGVMLSKSLISFSVDGWGCALTHSFGLRPNYGRGNGNLFQKDLCQHASTSSTLVSDMITCQATVDSCLHQRLPDTHR